MSPTIAFKIKKTWPPCLQHMPVDMAVPDGGGWPGIPSIRTRRWPRCWALPRSISMRTGSPAGHRTMIPFLFFFTAMTENVVREKDVKYYRSVSGRDGDESWDRWELLNRPMVDDASISVDRWSIGQRQCHAPKRCGDNNRLTAIHETASAMMDHSNK